MNDGTQRLVGLNPSAQPLAVLIHFRTASVAGMPTAGTFRLSSGSAVLGAGKEADFVLEDAAVSRRHLRVTLVPEGVAIEDLGSRNGTFFAGQKVERMTLSLGGKLQVGAVELTFVADREDFEGTRGRSVERYGELFGKSPAMQQLFVLLERLEGSLVNVLVRGESGTGKELVARALHAHSKVATGPLIVVNCGALDRSLIRSELFGHKKGAFTGAVSDSLGAIGEAEGGTLFLDEIGELPLEVQPMLLRVLESGTYARVGEAKERPARFRLICATHKNLQEEVAAGRFREDLYYRLMVVELSIPALRERRQELPELIQFLGRKLGLDSVPESVVRELSGASLPGNVRQLRNALAAYAAIGSLPTLSPLGGGRLELELESFVDLSRPYADLKDELTELLTRFYLTKLIGATDGNLSEASRVSGLQRGYLRSLMVRFGLREKS